MRQKQFALLYFLVVLLFITSASAQDTIIVEPQSVVQPPALEEEQQQEEVCSATDGTCAQSSADGAVVSPPALEDDGLLNLELGEDFGVMQEIDSEREQEILDLIQVARAYLQNTVYQDPKYAKVKDNCRNQHESCAFWAAVGECNDNAGFMNVSCAPMCQTCELIDFHTRCPLDPNLPNIWGPGDLSKMFERILSDPEFQQYEPVVLSRPTYAVGDTEDNATYDLGPWVITLENVVSEEEATRLIELGAEEGYKPSADVGALKFDGTFDVDINEGRTSTNAWCGDLCYADPLASAVMERLERITQIPDKNTEFLQLLKYEVGQFYQTHHDYIEFDVDRQNGVRILTVFLYLNDVEAGGGTNFPDLDLTVLPKRGRALLWPSVLDDDPHAKDFRTEHQALPVKKGIKYGANAWMHQRDFKTPHANNCL